MTLANDFIEEKGLEEDYPTAFGITFTPVVSGLALGILGIVGAFYIYSNMIAPAQKEYQTIQGQKKEKQAQLDEVKEKGYPEKIAQLSTELEQQTVLKEKVISMFTNPNDLETLLIDVNSFIAANQGTLLKYSPDSAIGTVNDDSLGGQVKGKLKKKGLALEIEGTFSQTQAIIQDLERLEPLLMITGYESKVTKKPTAILVTSQSEIVPQKAAILTTNLKIDAILPLSKEEIEQAAKAAEAKADKGEEKDKESEEK